MFTEFCAFLEDLYGGMHYLRETDFGTILYIENGPDKFKINLTDKNRFGKYTLFHQSDKKDKSGHVRFHSQLKTRNLHCAIFVAYAHQVHKNNNIYWHQEDIDRLMEDWRAWINGQIV